MRNLGFDDSECEAIVLVVSELGTNIAKYAGIGDVIAREIATETRRGVEIEAVDSGPGIADAERAFDDGYSTSGSLGYGLGTVSRLMDDVSISSVGEGGTRVVARRWLHARSLPAVRCSLDVGAASRPHPRMLGINGDAFVICRRESFMLVGVIDGLGHGQFAQRASQTARRHIEGHCESSLDDVFRGCGRACRPTRGVNMALARVDCEHNTLQLASIGNVEVKAHGLPQGMRYLVRRGIVGLNAPVVQVTEQPWSEDSVLLMASDGITMRWSWDDLPELRGMAATNMAAVILRKFARAEDDATVLVLRGASQ